MFYKNSITINGFGDVKIPKSHKIWLSLYIKMDTILTMRST